MVFWTDLSIFSHQPCWPRGQSSSSLEEFTSQSDVLAARTKYYLSLCLSTDLDKSDFEKEINDWLQAET